MTRSLEQEFRVVANLPFSSKPNPKTGAVKGDFARATQCLMNATYAFGWALASPESVSVAQRRMTLNVSKGFNKYISSLAVANPKAFWHMYAGTGHVGINKANYRLFNIAAPEGPLKSRVAMSLVYLPDKMLIKPDSRLYKGGEFQGKKGQYVKNRHKWPTKAFDLEFGRKVKIKRKKSEYLVFVGKGKNGKPKAVFLKGPITVDTSVGRNGTRDTLGSMTQAATTFSETMAPELAMRSYKRQTKAIKKAVEEAAVMSTKVNVPSKQLATTIARRVSAVARREGVV